jgi:putative PIN family toxin of toxin-antitoxin system
MIAAVFDCMIFLQAATSDQGPAFACLSFVESNVVRRYLSPAILAEVRDVLTRPKILAKFPHLTPERVDLFLQKLASISIVTADVPDAGVALRDPDDLPYLSLALATNAGYVVSRDRDLLDLMTDHAFVGRFPQLQIVDPVAFLILVRAARAS